MLESIFDIPLVIAGLAIVGSLCLFAIGGLLLVRRRPVAIRMDIYRLWAIRCARCHGSKSAQQHQD
jgi:hypothetical protein